MKPTYPKILSWLAHKAGLPMHRAEHLWHAAEQYAVQATGQVDTPAYWAAAMDRLLELVAAESLREDEASFGWRRWARLQQRYWLAPLQVLDALTLNQVRGVTRGWRSFRPIQFG